MFLPRESPPNLLLLMSDQHSPRIAGFAGHPHAATPSLDGLAARGARFKSSYCSSPICVPSRASLATGRHVHDLGTWDNAAPYVGGVRSWGHVLQDAGYRVVTIGKLHYRSPDDNTGFPDQRLAMHVHGGGDLRGVSLRSRGRVPEGGRGLDNLLNAGPGESDYTRFDRAVAAAAVDFLRDEAAVGPWALMVSFVAPHFPLIAPRPFFDLYDSDALILPPPDPGAWDHPAMDSFRQAFGLSRSLTESEQRRVLHAYLALCSFLDDCVGQVLNALRDADRESDTVVFYTSDHGESAGAHGLWFKHLMNEESVGVPLLMAGPGVTPGRIIEAPVSHVDLAPTLAQLAGASDEAVAGFPGRSLLGILNGAPTLRPVLSQYHANGSTSGSFMVREGRYKYIEYVGQRPQLFDLEEDPDEMCDLAREPDHAATIRRLAAVLRGFCDPEEVDEMAKADQDRRVEMVGGLEAAAAITVSYTPVPEVHAGRDPKG
jgi:choline-sulfatase